MRRYLPSLVPAFGWGAMFPIADSAIEHVDPFHLTAIRYLLASAGFLALLWMFEGVRALRLDGRGLELFLFGTAASRASTCSPSPASSTRRPSTRR